jgi:prefoldin subunit 5
LIPQDKSEAVTNIEKRISMLKETQAKTEADALDLGKRIEQVELKVP